VWEFYNPDIDEKQRKRAEIYRMTRLETSFVEAIRARAGLARVGRPPMPSP